MALEIGRVCMKVAGREAGKYCVVLKKIDDNFVLVTGPKELTGVKRRKCNVEHLEPTSYLVSIQAEANEKDVVDAYNKIGLTKKFELKMPSPEILKEAEKKVTKVPLKAEAPKEEKKIEKKEEKPAEKKEEIKETKPEEKPKEGKKGITLKIKLPSIRKGKKEEKKVEKKEVKKEKKPENLKRRNKRLND